MKGPRANGRAIGARGKSVLGMATRPPATRPLSPRQKAKRLARRLKAGVNSTILKKRTHRAKLAQTAQSHWKTEGDPGRLSYLGSVRTALVSEGFRPTRFQWRHKGQAFGLVKDHGDHHQVHVRVYENGIIDAEWELHRRYLSHAISPRPSAHKEIQRIFTKHGVPIRFVNEQYLPQVGAARSRFPENRTKVSHVIGGAVGVFGSVAVLSIARFALRRARLRA